MRATLSDLFTPLNDFVGRIPRMDKVWLAQIHGVAAGAGLSLVLACDLAIADAGARFMTAYLKLGATPDAGMTHGLMRAVGPKRALDLLLRHDAFTADDAMAWGIITRTAPAGELTASAQAYAQDIARHAPHGIAGAKAFQIEWTPRGWMRGDLDLANFEQQLYLRQPGYGTSYVTGKHELEQLIAELAKRWGDAFTMERFFEEVNAAGMIPVSLIRRQLLESAVER